MRNKQEVRVIQDETNPIPAELIAESIVAIGNAMRKINETRLTRRAIITLIHEDSKIGRRDIEIVLNNLDTLEGQWLKKK